MQLNSGHVLYTKGGEVTIEGVGFLVNKNIIGRVVELRGDSSRVASLTIKINTKYKLFEVPTSTHEAEEVEEFYEVVSKIMTENEHYYKVAIRDFNEKVGGHQQEDGAAVGHYSCGERNERRTRLVEFAASDN